MSIATLECKNFKNIMKSYGKTMGILTTKQDLIRPNVEGVNNPIPRKAQALGGRVVIKTSHQTTCKLNYAILCTGSSLKSKVRIQLASKSKQACAKCAYKKAPKFL